VCAREKERDVRKILVHQLLLELLVAHAALLLISQNGSVPFIIQRASKLGTVIAQDRLESIIT
jgi:hypothetical protein